MRLRTKDKEDGLVCSGALGTKSKDQCVLAHLSIPEDKVIGSRTTTVHNNSALIAGQRAAQRRGRIKRNCNNTP